MKEESFLSHFRKDIACHNLNGRLTGVISILLFNLSFQTITLYRLCHSLNKSRYLRKLTTPITYYQQRLSNCHISPSAVIGNYVIFPHPASIVIGSNVKIGDRVKIFQCVTIGSHGKPGKKTGYPEIEEDVTIFAGASVLGKVKVGKGSVIAAGAVVTKDVEAFSLVAGIPAKFIKELNNENEA